jgi:nucleoside-diphosphate-sugar epimerase
MTILITGASGFLGGRLAQVLIERREAVRVLVRRTSALGHLSGLQVEVLYGNLEEPESLAAAVAGVRLVYHCAACSTDWAPWKVYYTTNVLGVRNLLQAALREKKLERFLHVSTTDVYGYPLRPCDESFPITDIRLPYNRSKGLGEKAVWAAYRQKKMPVTVVRPATIYGPRGKDFVAKVAELIRQGLMPVVDGGRTPAGLIYVDNAVNGIIGAAAAPLSLGQAYNLRDDTSETWRQYVDALAEGLGRPPPWINLPYGLAFGLAALCEMFYSMARAHNHPLLTRHALYLLSRDQSYPIAKAQRHFGYRPHVSFQEGITRTIHWLNSFDNPGKVKAPYTGAH